MCGTPRKPLLVPYTKCPFDKFKVWQMLRGVSFTMVLWPAIYSVFFNLNSNPAKYSAIHPILYMKKTKAQRCLITKITHSARNLGGGFCNRSAKLLCTLLGETNLHPHHFSEDQILEYWRHCCWNSIIFALSLSLELHYTTTFIYNPLPALLVTLDSMSVTSPARCQHQWSGVHTNFRRSGHVRVSFSFSLEMYTFCFFGCFFWSCKNAEYWGWSFSAWAILPFPALQTASSRPQKLYQEMWWLLS